MTAKTKLSTKGQVIIPKEIRDSHGWGPGVELEIEDRGDHLILRFEPEPPPATVDEVFGCLRYDGPPATVEEMDTAVAEAIRRIW